MNIRKKEIEKMFGEWLKSYSARFVFNTSNYKNIHLIIDVMSIALEYFIRNYENKNYSYMSENIAYRERYMYDFKVRIDEKRFVDKFLERTFLYEVSDYSHVFSNLDFIEYQIINERFSVVKEDRKMLTEVDIKRFENNFFERKCMEKSECFYKFYKHNVIEDKMFFNILNDVNRIKTNTSVIQNFRNYDEYLEMLELSYGV